MGWKRDWHRIQARAKWVWNFTKDDDSDDAVSLFLISDWDMVLAEVYQSRRYRGKRIHPRKLVQVLRGET